MGAMLNAIKEIRNEIGCRRSVVLSSAVLVSAAIGGYAQQKPRRIPRIRASA